MNMSMRNRANRSTINGPWMPALLAGAALPLLITQPAFAQAGENASRNFSIPSQPLSDALTQFGRQSNLDVTADPDLIAGKSTAGVSGNLSAGEALSRLLAGTGLTFRFVSATGVTLERAPQAANGAIQLGPVRVEGSGASSIPTSLTDLDDPSRSPVHGYVVRRTMVGSKTDTPIVEVPQSISVVTAEEMQDRNVQSVVEAVQYTAGVQVSNFGGNEIRNDWIVVRGFDIKPSGDFRDGMAQVYYDQFRVKTPAYALERIDVIRGPASVLFGQIIPGGLVNRITKRPTLDPVREVQLQIGSYDRYQAAADFGGAIDGEGKYLFRLTGLARDSGTQDRYDADHRYNDDSVYIAPAFTWAPDENTTLTLMAHYQHDSNDGESRPVYPTRSLVGDYSFDRNIRDVYSAGYLFEHRFGEGFTVRQNARFTTGEIELRNLYRLGMVNDHTVSRYALYSKQQADFATIDTQGEARFTTGAFDHTLLIGLDYRHLWGRMWYRNGLAPDLDLNDPVYGQTIALPDAAGTWLDQSERRRQVGIYFQDQISFADKWVLTLGGRQDWAKNRIADHLANTTTHVKGDKFTWRAGLTYVSPSGIAPYLSYATSFEPQSGSDFFGNAFVPTTGEQYEAGIKYQPPGANSLLTLAVYQLTQQNVLTLDPDELHPGFSVQTGEVRARGVEIEGKAEILPNLNVTASYTYNDIKVTRSNNVDLGKVPTTTPRHLASVWASYTFDNGSLRGLGAGLGARYMGETYANNINTIVNDDYVMMDANVHYDWGNWRLAVNANNLFDKETVVCRNSAINCRYGVARTVIGTLSYRF